MWTSSAILYISLFCHLQIHTAIFIFFSNTMYYTFQRLFLRCTCRISLSFTQSQSKAGVVNQMSHLCFRRRSTIDQLNVQTATAEKEKLYSLSKIINIKF